MSQTIKQLSQMDGRVYVFFKTEALCQQFLSQAEQEGFTFQDGAKPTERHTSDIIAVNNDFTINYGDRRKVCVKVNNILPFKQ